VYEQLGATAAMTLRLMTESPKLPTPDAKVVKLPLGIPLTQSPAAFIERDYKTRVSAVLQRITISLNCCPSLNRVPVKFPGWVLLQCRFLGFEDRHLVRPSLEPPGEHSPARTHTSHPPNAHAIGSPPQKGGPQRVSGVLTIVARMDIPGWPDQPCADAH
jgi:hypothetical protein